MLCQLIGIFNKLDNNQSSFIERLTSLHKEYNNDQINPSFQKQSPLEIIFEKNQDEILKTNIEYFYEILQEKLFPLNKIYLEKQKEGGIPNTTTEISEIMSISSKGQVNENFLA